MKGSNSNSLLRNIDVATVNHCNTSCTVFRIYPHPVKAKPCFVGSFIYYVIILKFADSCEDSQLASSQLPLFSTLSLGVGVAGGAELQLSIITSYMYTVYRITISCYTNEIFPSDSSHKELESGDLATLSLGVGVAGGAELHLPVIWMFSTISWLWTCPRSDSKPNNTNNPENEKGADKMGVWEIQCNAWWHHTDFLNVQTFGQEHILETFQNESIFQYNLV